VNLSQRWKQTSVANKLLVYTGALVAFGTFFYAGAAVFQVCLMHISAVETAKQNDKLIAEAKRIAATMEESNRQNQIALDASLKQAQRALDASIENARLDQRAWISCKGLKSEKELKAGELNPFWLTFINSGKTPAQHFRINYTSRLHIPGKPDVVTTVLRDENLSLDPGREAVWRFDTVPPRLNQVDIDGLESGTFVLTISGEVTYQDVFAKLHKTAYCAFYKPELKPDFALCSSGNYAE
jgi:hypothetical protein